jgi:hypothetical protein
VTLKVASSFSADIGVSYGQDVNDAQFYGSYGALANDTTHYTFAHLDQRTLSITTRLNFTATPTLSVQIYTQPFMTGGDFSDWRELANPRAAAYMSRFQPYNGGTLDDFNFRQFRSNSVVRWEYRPGSSLYFVWAQERTSVPPGKAPRFNVRDDARALFGSHPGNVFLIKGSYWLSM